MEPLLLLLFFVVIDDDVLDVLVVVVVVVVGLVWRGVWDGLLGVLVLLVFFAAIVGISVVGESSMDEGSGEGAWYVQLLVD